MSEQRLEVKYRASFFDRTEFVSVRINAKPIASVDGDRPDAYIDVERFTLTIKTLKRRRTIFRVGPVPQFSRYHYQSRALLALRFSLIPMAFCCTETPDVQ